MAPVEPERTGDTGTVEVAGAEGAGPWAPAGPGATGAWAPVDAGPLSRSGAMAPVAEGVLPTGGMAPVEPAARGAPEGMRNPRPRLGLAAPSFLP